MLRDKPWHSPKRLPDIFSYSALALAILAIFLTLVRSIPFLKIYIPSDWNLNDAVVGFMSIVIISLHVLRNEIKTDTTRIIDSIEGVQFRQFQSGHEKMLHIARQINRATASVCDVSWVDYLGPERLAPERKSAQVAYDDAIALFSAHKPYREIFIFDGMPEFIRRMRLESIRRRVENKEGGYYCSYLPKSIIPKCNS